MSGLACDNYLLLLEGVVSNEAASLGTEYHVGSRKTKVGCSEPRGLQWGRGVGGYTCRHEVEARIVPGVFYLRQQHWMIAPIGHEASIFQNSRSATISAGPARLTQARPYLVWVSSLATAAAVRAACASLMKAEEGEWRVEEECRRCQTEFQVFVEKVNGRLALRITVWRGLGACETPLNPVWACHFEVSRTLKRYGDMD
jgi:hypothetical protein